MFGHIAMRLRFAGVLLAALTPFASLGWAQSTGPYNEHEVKRSVIKEEKDKGVWALEFRFKDPRLITVDLPGKGKTLCWYMWYQVINYTDEAQRFVPRVELVTIDKNTVHVDKVYPKAMQAIIALENPLELQSGFPENLKIKNSVTISGDPIPVSKPEAAAKTVTGVAVWDDVDPETTRFSIFVSGLSNGWSVDDRGVVRRKTLQLNFRRMGDRFFQDAREIRFLPPAEWIYRATKLKDPGAKPKDDPKENLGLKLDLPSPKK